MPSVPDGLDTEGSAVREHGLDLNTNRTIRSVLQSASLGPGRHTGRPPGTRVVSVRCARPHGALCRHSTRPVRGPFGHRRGRDGRGLQGPGHAPGPGRRHQGPARRSDVRSRTPPPLRAGGPRGGCPLPSQHRRALRHRHARGRAVSRLGVARRPDARRRASGRRVSGRESRRDRRPDRAGPRRGPRERDRPPRSEAGQCVRDRGRARRKSSTSAWPSWPGPMPSPRRSPRPRRPAPGLAW